MQVGGTVVVGSGGLLGEIMEVELARHGPVTNLTTIQELTAIAGPLPGVIAVWADASTIGSVRTQLRRVLPDVLDPLLIFLSESDPYIYFTRLRALHVDRRYLGFYELFDEISGRVSTGVTTTVPARAGLVLRKGWRQCNASVVPKHPGRRSAC